MKRTVLFLLLFAAAGLFISPRDSTDATTGVLILAHGHEESWNQQITDLAAHLPFPAEVALGMAHKKTIAEGVTLLEKKGVRNIVVVPLFVSSHSSIIRASAYLLGLTREAPPELHMFNTMSHGLQNPHSGHDGKVASMDLSPIRSRVPIQMTSALDDHPLVAQILLDRARSVSRDPKQEAVVLVGHGPNSETDNRLWQEKMNGLAVFLRERGEFAAVEALTVMDDAPAEVREQATARLRQRVEAASRSGSVLVVPVLLSRGGIENGLQERLAGLKYKMPAQFLLPDPRIVQWVKEQVASAVGGPPAQRSSQ